MTVQVFTRGKKEPDFEIEEFKGICPFCIQEGQTSRLYEGGCSSTMMYCKPFYDEQGVRHHHDSNTKSYGFNCSNGHRFGLDRKGSCQCGWTGGLAKITLY